MERRASPIQSLSTCIPFSFLIHLPNEILPNFGLGSFRKILVSAASGHPSGTEATSLAASCPNKPWHENVHKTNHQSPITTPVLHIAAFVLTDSSLEGDVRYL